MAISRFRASTDSKNLNGYRIDMLGSALNLFGALRDDSQILDEAIDIYRRALRLDTWTLPGRAHMFRQLGEVLKHKASWTEALEAFTSAAQCQPQSIFTVFTAECYLHLNQSTLAVNHILSVDRSRLSASELTDYVFVFSAVFVEIGDQRRLEEAESLLRQQGLTSPLFRSCRDSLLISVVGTRRSGRSDSFIRTARRAIAQLLTRANRYLLLEPNIMGFGVRLNAILGDLAKAADQHSGDGKQK